MSSSPNPQPHRTTTLSVLVPVYNEQYLVAASLDRLRVLADSPLLDRVQIIVVDDRSADQTPEVLRKFAVQDGLATGKLRWEFLQHERNQGKGGAVRTAIERADCELSVIHDADLEYHPRDLLRMIPLFLEEGADAVFGSRFMAGEFKRALFWRHSLGNKLLTWFCDVACDLDLTDMETCYKMVRTDLLRTIPLASRDYRIEPELTIKLAKRGARIYEVPISYTGRTYQEGKKIRWTDGVKALLAIARFRLSDNVFKPDRYGSHVAERLRHAPRYTNWMANTVRPFVGDGVLELGASVGSTTLQLIPRASYYATDPNPLFVRELEKLRDTRPYLRALQLDPSQSFAGLNGTSFDTVICQNVLEHVADDATVLRQCARVLKPGGRVLVLVPQTPELMGRVDEYLGHRRRYRPADLERLAAEAGLKVAHVAGVNRAGSAAWWINARLLRRRQVSFFQMKMLNFATPLLRVVDPVLPLPPLTLFAVLEKPAVEKTSA
jgi:glycosyltransferase involved in cell wall biosynthesis/phospholipid N-methyltransferase